MTRAALAFAGGLAVVAAVPVVARALRSSPAERCALDGVEIPPRDRVRIEGAGAFCSVGCAEAWMRREGGGDRRVFVVDETTGREIASEAAWFVRSRVRTSERTGNRIHAFAERTEAERHAATFGGTLLQGPDRPFP